MATYIVSDPNTRESQQGQFVQYTDTQIANAAPFWAGVPSSDPSGGGTGGGLQCGSMPNPFDTEAFAKWLACITAGGSGSGPDPFSGLETTFASVFGGIMQGAIAAMKRIGVFIIGFAVVLLGGLMLYRGTLAQESAGE